jgi:diaminopimelate decarboxylase
VPHVEGGSTAGNETGSARSKFGMTIQEINQSIEFAADSPTTLAVVGLHVHIGSQMTELGLYADAARYVAKQGAHLRARFASDFGHVNIGGGFPKNYVKYNDQSPEIGYFHSAVTVEDVAATVAPILTGALGPDIEVLTEPGRAMTSDSAVCLARVECMKRRDDSTWLYLDTGYSVVPESGFGWYFHMVRANHADEQTTARFRVVGPLCDSIDVYFDAEGESKLATLLEAEPALKHHERLLRNTIVRTPPYRELPASTAPGDLVAILDTGAYQLEMASHYCGRMIPAAVMINDGGEVQCIRRRDTLEDLLDKER